MAGESAISKTDRRKLLDFVDIEVLREILEAFTETTGLMANIVDTEGKSIFSRETLSKCCTFCRLIYSMENGLERCRGAYKRAGKQAAIFREPYVFRCPSGLVEWAAPIIVDGQHLGSLICGQVLMWQPEEFFWIELREMNQGLTSDFTELFKAVDELPIVSPSMVRSASYLMYIVANYITKSGWEQYIHAKEIAYQQSLLHSEIENRKHLEEKLTDQVITYNISLEAELTMKIKLGEAEAARQLMDKLLASTAHAEGNQLVAAQTRVIELCVIISRSAVSAGVDMDTASRKNGEAFTEIHNESTSQGVCILGRKLLDYYLAEIQSIDKAPSNSKVSEIKKYIRKHYGENLALGDIATAVYLSPTYVSRLFKKIENCSVMEYVTRVRMEEAKQLLEDPQYLVETVAIKTGFADSGYFTKVFRRTEGVTPTQYRKACLKQPNAHAQD